MAVSACVVRVSPGWARRMERLLSKSLPRYRDRLRIEQVRVIQDDCLRGQMYEIGSAQALEIVRRLRVDTDAVYRPDDTMSFQHLLGATQPMTHRAQRTHPLSNAFPHFHGSRVGDIVKSC